MQVKMRTVKRRRFEDDQRSPEVNIVFDTVL